MNVRKIVWLLLFVFSNLFFIQASHADEIDKIVVFGDSLSDNGNDYSLSTKAHKVTSAIPVVPKNPPYYEGRFSNGLIWVELLAQSMNVPLADYAYGGSWAESFSDSGLVFPFSLSSQLDMYLVGAAIDFHKDKHLFVIWSGGNDYVQGRDDAEYATTNTVNYIKAQIDSLVYHNAKHILIMNLPDLQLAPAVIKKGPDFVEKIRVLSKLHNDKLKAMIEEEIKLNPEVKFVYADVTDDMDDIILNPEKYNLKNIKDVCYGGDYYFNLQSLARNPEVIAAKAMNMEIERTPSLKIAYLNAKAAEAGVESCKNPNEYIFWDQLHPTAYIHSIVAKMTLEELKKHGITGKA